MNKSKAISLKNLALRLCGEPADSEITRKNVYFILNYLKTAVFGKNLKTWYADKPFPPYESELEGIFGFKKYGERFDWAPYAEIKSGELEWKQFIEKYTHKILVRRDDFENYLKNALLKNNVAVNSALEEWNEEKKEPTGHIKYAKQGYNNLIKEGKFLTRLKDLCEKNQPWSENTGAASAQGEATRKSPIPDFIASAEIQIKAKTRSLANALIKTAPRILSNPEMQSIILSLREQLGSMLDVRGSKQGVTQRLNDRKIKTWINAALKSGDYKPKPGRPKKAKKK